MITQARVQELFKLNLRTGHLVRRFKRGKAEAGTHSTAKDRDGYLVLGIDGKLYRAHRIVWLYVHGEFPPADIDHINGAKDDNRPKNLRAVTRSQNKQNQGPTKNNKSGFKGVYRSHDGKYWNASICHKRENHFLGQFKLLKDAATAYAVAAGVFHTHNPSSKG